MPVIKVLISDAEESHGNTCESKILEECPTATTEVRIESLASSVVYALANGFHIISRSTTGLSDSRNENEGDTAYDGAELTDGGFSSGFSFGFDSAGTWRVGIVHVHGSNSHVLDTDPSQLDVISSVSAGDGSGNCDASYGAGLEYFDDDETTQSNATARVAGVIAQILVNNPTWNFHDARQAIRQTASFYATGWVADGGYGAIDKDAAKAVTSLGLMSPTRPSYTQDGTEVIFSWVNSWNTNASETVLARFDSSPGVDDEPTIIEYSGNNNQDIYIHTSETGTFYFAFMTVDEDGNYSHIESFDIEAITFTTTEMVDSFVYHINNGRWSKFANMDVIRARQLQHTTDNVVLIMDSSRTIMKYPGSSNIDDDLRIKTKKYYIDNSKMRKVLLNFTGSPSITVRVWNDKFDSEYEDYAISSLTDSQWKAIAGGYIGDYVEFIIDDATTIESLFFEISRRE